MRYRLKEKEVSLTQLDSLVFSKQSTLEYNAYEQRNFSGHSYADKTLVYTI